MAAGLNVFICSGSKEAVSSVQHHHLTRRPETSLSVMRTPTNHEGRGEASLLTNQGWTCGQLVCQTLPPPRPRYAVTCKTASVTSDLPPVQHQAAAAAAAAARSDEKPSTESSGNENKY